MPVVTIGLPSMLAGVTGHSTLTVEANTVDEAVERAFAQEPVLRSHICDETGRFRPHVLCFLNDVNSRWFENPEQPLQDGDCITFLQAGSGG